jgi:lipopolysaccharide biosynthesis glycosyltransferase
MTAFFPRLRRRLTGQPSREPIVIGCATDTLYAASAAVMLRSLRRHLPCDRPAELYMLHPGLPETAQNMLRDAWSGDVTFLQPNEAAFGTLRPHPGKSTCVYYKLLLPALVPHPRILYLDCDMLVRADIAPLWETDLEGCAAGAVQDMGVPYVSSEPWGLARYREHGLDPRTPYFNAGMLLMDTKRWRRERITEQVLRYTEEHDADVRLWDQDGFNAVLAGRWKMLDPRWNAIGDAVTAAGLPIPPELAETARLQSIDPFIIHFAGSKPWEPGCNHPKRALFLSEMQKLRVAGTTAAL